MLYVMRPCCAICYVPVFCYMLCARVVLYVMCPCFAICYALVLCYMLCVRALPHCLMARIKYVLCFILCACIVPHRHHMSRIKYVLYYMPALLLHHVVRFAMRPCCIYCAMCFATYVVLCARVVQRRLMAHPGCAGLHPVIIGFPIRLFLFSFSPKSSSVCILYNCNCNAYYASSPSCFLRTLACKRSLQSS